MIQECCSAIPAKKFFLSACLECVLGPLPVRLVWRNCRCNKDEPLEPCGGPKLPEHNLTFECPINDQQLQHKLKLEVLSYEQKQRSWCVLKLPCFAQMRHWGCRTCLVLSVPAAFAAWWHEFTPGLQLSVALTLSSWINAFSLNFYFCLVQHENNTFC